MMSNGATPAAKTARRRRRPTLSLAVEGYKAVRHRQQLRLAPLTVIAGVNSSGKSSFMQPFLLMKQTLDSAFDPGALLLYGANVKVTDHSQIFSRGKSKADSVDRFTVGLISDSGDEREVTFGSQGGSGLKILSDVMRSERSGEIRLSENMTSQKLATLREQFGDKIDSHLGRLFRDQNRDRSGWEPRVSRNRCFLDVEMSVSIEGSDLTLPMPYMLGLSGSNWVDVLRGIIHVPGLRGNPERSYQRSATGDTFPGTFETYVASLIYEWSEKDQQRLALLASDLEQLGLTWKVQARRLNDASIELLVGRMPHAQQGGAHDLVSVADVGFGVSQTLPVLAALHAARRNQIVYIEQPEIHLHPRAQLALARVLIDATKRGVVIVVETHSSLLIRGIQTEVARGSLLANDLSMNWFSRNLDTGAQEVVVAQLDPMGRFGDWPVDFDDISRDADWAYLDAIEDRS